MSGRILVTGAAGAIGTSVSQGLADRYQLRGLDLVAPASPYPGEVLLGDCADPSLALRAVEGVDAVVHLAGIATEASLPDILHSHVDTTAALLDAMVMAGVPRMVFASSNHAVGMTPSGGVLGTDARPRPDTFYGVGKVAAEALLSLYADRYGVSCLAVRIGSFEPAPTTRRHLATWLSPADCLRLVDAGLTASFEGYRVVYGISANSGAWWDLEPGHALGYHPQDDAADYASTLPSLAEDELEAARVGGSFATGRYDRRPFAQDD